MKNFKKRNCFLCGSDRLKLICRQRFAVLVKNYAVSECQQCGLMQQNPLWSKNFYHNLYADLIYDPTGIKYHKAKINRYQKVAEVIADLISGKKLKLLDFGCYDGSFLEWLKRHGQWSRSIQLIGYDIFLKGINHHPLFYNSLSQLKGEGKFDLVVMNHVLEHIFDPLKTLSLIKKDLLENNGYLIVEVPNLAFIREDDISPFHIQHISYFTPTTLSLLGKMAGLATVLVKTFDNIGANREPYSPTVLVVFKKDEKFLTDSSGLEMAIQLNKKKLAAKVRKLGKISLGIVGCGDVFFVVNKILQKIDGIKIGALFDNNKNLWGTKINGLSINSPAETATAKCDYFLVCTLNQHNTEEIINQLNRYGIDRRRIVTLLN